MTAVLPLQYNNNHRRISAKPRVVSHNKTRTHYIVWCLQFEVGEGYRASFTTSQWLSQQKSPNALWLQSQSFEFIDLCIDSLHLKEFAGNWVRCSIVKGFYTTKRSWGNRFLQNKLPRCMLCWHCLTKISCQSLHAIPERGGITRA